MGIKLTSTSKKIHWVNMLCYGESGIGKTVLCSTAPKPIIISAEKGLLSLSDMDIPTIEVNNITELREAYEFVKDNDDYETICIDSISEVAQKLLIEYKEAAKDPRKAYGKMADDMGNIVRKIRDIPNKHKYFIAKQDKVTDEGTGKTTFEPLIPGKVFAADLPYFFDVVVCMRIGRAGKEEYRYLQTQPSLQYPAKDRSKKLAPKEKPDLGNLINKIRGEV